MIAPERVADDGAVTSAVKARVSSLPLGKSPHVRKRRGAQSLKVVAALERGHNPALGVAVSHGGDRPRGPGEILGLQGLATVAEAGQSLEAADFAWATRAIASVANRRAKGRVVSSLEGGYDLEALGQSALAHVRALAEG